MDEYLNGYLWQYFAFWFPAEHASSYQLPNCNIYHYHKSIIFHRTFLCYLIFKRKKLLYFTVGCVTMQKYNATQFLKHMGC